MVLSCCAAELDCRATFRGKAKRNGPTVSVTVGEEGKKFHVLEPSHVGEAGEVDGGDQGAGAEHRQLVGGVRRGLVVLVSVVLVVFLIGCGDGWERGGQVVEGCQGKGCGEGLLGALVEDSLLRGHTALSVLWERLARRAG